MEKKPHRPEKYQSLELKAMDLYFKLLNKHETRMQGAAMDENRKYFVADSSESPLKVYFAKVEAFKILNSIPLGCWPL